ncbi:MAG: cytochrome ubiquinol oxidase subunit I [Bacteroidales bacterium]|nr:cytochrome ubiquinol oxidase subunit I [Bacteroidales bacterium]
MEALEIARWQFGITTIYHFFFVPITMGLAVLTAILHTFYYRTGSLDYKRLTKFFGKLFVIIFALGVVTGIVLEFQFGMAWSAYSRFVGDIFGIPLAIEALLAFFLESTFIAVWLFGWNKLPKGLHLLSIWLVAIGSNLSAIWILIANAWMQVPVGYVLNEGRAELSDFIAVMLNEQMLIMAQHTIIAAFTTGGLFMLGISAWHILRKNQVEIFSKSAHIALVFTAVSSLLVATTGHKHAQHTVKHQPMKMAAMEGMWESEKPASFSLFAIINQENKTSLRELKLPYMLTVLAYNNLTSEVKGLNELQQEYEETYGPGDYLPPVALVYWSFRFMVGLGMLFILFSIFGLVQWWRNKLTISRPYLRLATIIMFLPLLANTLGWIVAEMGRQPWIVHGLMFTRDGVSPNVSSSSMALTTIAFTLVYGLLAAVAVYLVHRFAKSGVPDDDAATHAY